MSSLVRRSFEGPPDPFYLYAALEPKHPQSFFLDSPPGCRNQARWCYLGWDPDGEIILTPRRAVLRDGRRKRSVPAQHFFDLVRAYQRGETAALASHSPFSGGLVGYLAYEFVSQIEPVRLRTKPGLDLPLARFGIYRTVVAYDRIRKKYELMVCPRPGETPGAARRRCDLALKTLQNLSSEFERDPFNMKGFHPETSRKKFEAMVRKAKEYIAAGDIYQANLSQRFLFAYEGSPIALYRKLREINPSPFAAMMKWGDTVIVSGSPERLVQKRGRLCETRPIAGTRPLRTLSGTVLRKKTVPSKFETLIEKELLASPKERAEHLMLVDLERNDLGRVCDFRSVKVREMMTTERYSHVVHLVSQITGKLRKDRDAWDLIRAMFPGGTITGCPKIRCMEIIDELETARRGLYTGSLGYIGFNGDVDLNIVIRTLVLQKGLGVIQVGAGIVHDSDPRKEYEETLHKAEALAEALAFAGAPS